MLRLALLLIAVLFTTPVWAQTKPAAMEIRLDRLERETDLQSKAVDSLRTEQLKTTGLVETHDSQLARLSLMNVTMAALGFALLAVALLAGWKTIRVAKAAQRSARHAARVELQALEGRMCRRTEEMLAQIRMQAEHQLDDAKAKAAAEIEAVRAEAERQIAAIQAECCRKPGPAVPVVVDPGEEPPPKASTHVAAIREYREKIDDGKDHTAIAVRTLNQPDGQTPAQLRASALRAVRHGNGAQAAQLLEKLCAVAPNDPWTWIELNRLHVNQGRLGAARDAATSAHGIASQWAESRTEDLSAQRDVSACLDEFGDIAQTEGDLAAARLHYQAAKDIAQRLVDSDPANTHCQRDLSISWNRLGDIAKAEDDLATAQHAYQAARDIRLRLAESDPANSQWQRDLTLSWNNVGDIAHARGDLASARQAYEAAKDIRERFAQSDPTNSQWQRDVLVCWAKLGEILLAEKNPEAAHDAFVKARWYCESVLKTDPGRLQWRVDLAEIDGNLGDVAAAENNADEARRHWGHAMAALVAIANEGRLDAYGRELLMQIHGKAMGNQSVNSDSGT